MDKSDKHKNKYNLYANTLIYDRPTYKILRNYVNHMQRKSKKLEINKTTKENNNTKNFHTVLKHPDIVT